MSVLDAQAFDVGDWSETESFVEDGHALYRLSLDEIHDGIEMDRRVRKARRKWVKRSGKSRKAISTVIPPGELDPFAVPMPHPQQIRAWVLDGTLLPVED